jgi:adenylyltransferase/sulfurtransferase
MACDEGGVLGPLPGAIGSLMALEVIKLLTGLGEQSPSGRGTLLVLDGLGLRTQALSFAASADNPLRDTSWQPDAEYYTQFCSRGVVNETSSFSLSAQRVTSMLASDGAQLLDVRSAPERAVLSFAGEHIPLGELARRLDEHELDLEMGSPIIVYCASGVRSRSAVALLRQQGYEAYDIAGGLKAYLAARAARSAALGR